MRNLLMMVLVVFMSGCSFDLDALHGTGVVGDAGSAVDADSSDASFIPEDAGSCFSPCDPVLQCGCPAGQACHFNGTTVMLVCAAAGISPQGATCLDNFDCAPGYSCSTTAGHYSVCMKYCRDDSGCASVGAASICVPFRGPFDFGICLDSCNPVRQLGCQAGGACDITFREVPSGVGTFCREAGLGTQGQTCARLEECAAGYACVGTAGATHCEALCIVAGTVTCSAGLRCLPYSGFGVPATIASINYGVCQ
jgi:hypothetical protein